MFIKRRIRWKIRRNVIVRDQIIRSLSHPVISWQLLGWIVIIVQRERALSRHKLLLLLVRHAHIQQTESQQDKSQFHFCSGKRNIRIRLIKLWCKYATYYTGSVRSGALRTISSGFGGRLHRQLLLFIPAARLVGVTDKLEFYSNTHLLPHQN